MLGKTEFHVKNSTDVVNFLKDFEVEDNEMLVLCPVTDYVFSMFTSTLMDDMLE